MVKHTPGPWDSRGEVKWVGDENSQSKLYVGDIRPVSEDFRGQICTIQSADHIKGISREEAAANACLIKAAPELLDCLRELYAIVRGECPSLLNEDSGGNAELELAIVEAIAKAEGRTDG
ncbi:hypothetical protein D3C87_1781660 [compost metagenome]